MVPWRECLMVTAPGLPVPRTVAARAGLLRGWAEGLRTRVRAVTTPTGEPLAPSDVDWTGIPGGEPQRRAGRPETGRGIQTLVRSTEEQRAAWDAAAKREGLTIGVWAAAALDVAAARTK